MRNGSIIGRRQDYRPSGRTWLVREQSHATGTNRIPTTISIGAAFFDAGTQTHHEALLAADTALHEATVAGGDRAIMHESSPGA